MKSYAEKQIVVAGVRLTYLDIEPSQPATKSPLLLLHGLLATAETLTELIGKLPGDRRIVALDLLSAAGEADADELDVRLEGWAVLIGRFVQRLGLKRPVLIGHSHGGTLALWLAAALDSEVEGLALLCPAHPFEGYRSHVVAFYLTRWGRFLALSIPLAPSWMILRAYNQAAGPDKPITMGHLRPYLGVLRNRNRLRRVLLMLRSWETDMSELRRAMIARPIAQPTLLIWGDCDVVVPISTAVALERSLTTSERTTLHGKGHLLVEEAPEECGSLIRTWLSWLDTGRLPRVAPAAQAGESRPNSSESQARIAARSKSSFDSGD